jgi:hypothetical protein
VCCVRLQSPNRSSCPAEGVPAVSKLLSFTALPTKDEAALLEALKTGPIAVSVTVDATFMEYSGGVYASTACTRPVLCAATNNHAMVIVGAGRDEELGVDYWLLRNRYDMQGRWIPRVAEPWVTHVVFSLPSNQPMRCRAVGESRTHPLVTDVH